MSEALFLMGHAPDPRDRTRNDRGYTAPDPFTPPAVSDDDEGFELWTKADLKAALAEEGISVPSRWTKAQLIEKLESL